MPFNLELLESKTHSISLDDVRKYLAFLPGDSSTVGISGHVDHCLIARTLKWKYHTKHAGVFDWNTHAIVGNTEEWVTLGQEVKALADDFDAIGFEVGSKEQHMVPVTRGFFYARHPEMR